MERTAAIENRNANPPKNSAPSDEINLVDLGVALARRWKLMLSIIVICTGLGLIAALVRQPSYSYTASIQLAAYTLPNGKLIQTMSPQSAVSVLQNGLIDQALSQYASASKIDPRRIKISAQSPRKSDVVVLSGKGPLSAQATYVGIEKHVAALLAQRTSGQVNAYQADLQAALETAKLELAKLKDPNRVAAAKAALKQRWLSAKTALLRLKRQHSVLKQRIASLKQSAKLDTALAKQLEGYLTRARSESLASSRAATPVEAMTAMLLGNQIQKNLQQLTNIERQLSVTLPQQIAQAQANLATNSEQQATQQVAVDRAKLEYRNFDVEQQHAIQGQQVTVNKLQSRQDSIQSTRLIASPARSVEPVGKSRKVIVVLAVVVGIFLALLAAAVSGYLSAVRTAIAS